MASKKYQYENLLREPVEFVAAWAYFIGVAIILLTPEILLMPPIVAYIGAVIFFFRGMQRYQFANRLKKYQKQIQNLPSFTLSSKQIGFSYKKLWLGRGFEWDVRHTQRVYDLEQDKNRKFREKSKAVEFIRQAEMKYEHSLLAPIFKFTSSNSRFNPFKPIPDVGGSPKLHAVGMWEGENDIYMDLNERGGHMLVLGTTGVGKTRLAEVLISQDIARGDVVIVIDPKGDGDLLKRCYVECKNAGRLDDFHIFHLGFPEVSEGYNPIGNFMRITEAAGRVATNMPGGGESQAFKDFVWGYVNVICVALIDMGKIPDFDLLKLHASNIEKLFIEYMEWNFKQQVKLGNLDHYYQDKINYNLKQLSIEKKEMRDKKFNETPIPRTLYSRSHKAIAIYKFYEDHPEIHTNSGRNLAARLCEDTQKSNNLTASLIPFLDKVTSGKIGELLSPSRTNKTSFNWSDVIQQGGVVYVGLDALSDAVVAAAVGNSMFSDITSVAGRLYKESSRTQFSVTNNNKERKIIIHADEFNELIGDEFIPLLNKSRGAGMQVCAYTQTLSDINARLGNKDKAGQIIGNTNTRIMMRVKEPATAKFMVDGLKKVQVMSVDLISSVTDVSDTERSGATFTSNAGERINKQSTELITSADLLDLPIGQAFIQKTGNRMYKIRLPLPNKNDLKDVPTEITAIAESMNINKGKDFSANFFSMQLNQFGNLDTGIPYQFSPLSQQDQTDQTDQINNNLEFSHSISNLNNRKDGFLPGFDAMYDDDHSDVDETNYYQNDDDGQGGF